jgi:chloramphenicol 3-O-phosphotransferase
MDAPIFDLASSIIFITGISAAGKSTVAQALAERLPKSVHLRGDLFRRLIVNGEAEITATLSDEAHQQLGLRYRIAATTTATMYADAGFAVVYQDVVLGTYLPNTVALLQGYSVYVVVLAPSVAVVTEREAARRKTGYTPDLTIADLDRGLREETPRIGLWVDSSQMTVAETVDTILARLDEARISPPH